MNAGVKRKTQKSQTPKRHFFRMLFRASCSVLNIVATILLLGSIFSPMISPQVCKMPAFLGLLFPFIMLYIFGLLVLNLIFHRPYKVLYLGILLIISIPYCLIYFPLNSPKHNIPEDRIKLLSLNVMSFQYVPHEANNPNPTLVYLRDSGADIICLQEAYMVREGKSKLTEDMVRTFLPQYPYIDLRKAQSDGSYLMLLSKFPIEYARTLPLKSKFNGAASYCLNVNGKELRLFNVHLETSGIRPNDGDEYLTLVKEGKAMEITRRFGLKMAPNYTRRAIQADRLALEVTKALHSTPYVLLCGDFNDTPISYVRNRLTKNLKDLYVTTGCGPGYSYTYKGIGIRIDHILSSKAIQGYNCIVDRSVYISDHKPISCFFTLNP